MSPLWVTSATHYWLEILMQKVCIIRVPSVCIIVGLIYPLYRLIKVSYCKHDLECERLLCIYWQLVTINQLSVCAAHIRLLQVSLMCPYLMCVLRHLSAEKLSVQITAVYWRRSASWRTSGSTVMHSKRVWITSLGRSCPCEWEHTLPGLPSSC